MATSTAAESTDRASAQPLSWWPGVALLVAITVGAVIAHEWGDRLLDSGRAIKVGFPPLHAEWDVHVDGAHVVVFALVAALVVAGPTFVDRASWRMLTATAPIASAAWTVALNATRGRRGFVQGIDNRHEYLADVGSVASPLQFLRDFAADFDSFAVHTRGHPPGFVIVLWFLDVLGLGGGGWAAALCIAAGAATVAVVLVTVRDVVGEATARAAAPFVAIAPVALWVGTSGDAFFASVAAVAVCAMVRAALRPAQSAQWAIGGGIAYGLALLCSYGLVLIVAIPLVVAVRAGRVRTLIPAAMAGAGVLLVAFSAGFDYLEGLRLTREAYFDGVASVRPYGYSLLANTVAFSVALGPAVVVAVTRVRSRLAWLVVGALAAVVLATISGMSKLEVERIWLPFAFWVLPACASLAPGSPMRTTSARWMRPWLAAQAAFAVLIQTLLRTGW